MAQGIFNVVAEDPEVEHVAEDMEEASVEEHGGNKGEVDGKRRGSVKCLAGHDLVRNRPPLEDESLAFDDIQRYLMIKDPAVGQNEPQGDDGKSQGGIVVLKRDEQRSGPLFSI